MVYFFMPKAPDTVVTELRADNLVCLLLNRINCNAACRLITHSYPAGTSVQGQPVAMGLLWSNCLSCWLFSCIWQVVP